MLWEVLAPPGHRGVNEWGKVASTSAPEAVIPKLFRDRCAGSAHSRHDPFHSALQLVVPDGNVISLGFAEHREYLVSLSSLCC